MNRLISKQKKKLSLRAIEAQEKEISEILPDAIEAQEKEIRRKEIILKQEDYFKRRNCPKSRFVRN